MRLSLAWLREWVDWGESDTRLLGLLPLRGFEIEAVTPFAVAFEGVRLARVVRVDALGNREGRVLELDTGGATRARVVTGDPRPATGDLLAYAAPGARLPGGTVTARTIGEVLSEGFVCSWSELGLGREHDRVLTVPDPGVHPGQDLAALLAAETGTLVEVAVTPNRGDCMSVHGLAREISAILRVPLRRQPPLPDAGPWVEDLVSEDPAAAPWFSLLSVTDVRPRRLSLRRRLRLEQAGVSSQHPLVDLTNYVLLELGQPLHAFDAARVGQEIRVRWACEGESLELLGGESLSLGPRHLVVADESGPLSLAGVLGGRSSALDETTACAWVEAAHFDPRALGRRPERLRIVTDAAQRFERGVDPELPPRAVARLRELLREESVGVAAPVIRRAPPHPSAPRRITLPRGETGRRLGCPEEAIGVREHLEALGLSVTPGAESYDVTVPLHRFDLAEPVDLVEEVARLHGFENLPEATPAGRLVLPAPRDLTPRYRLEDTARRFLAARGYDECRHLALVDPEDLERLEPEREPVRLSNPLSREISVLASTLWARLLHTARENLRRQQQAVRLFETAAVFAMTPHGPEERRVLALVGAGPALPERWCNERRRYDFYDLRGDTDELLHVLFGRRPVWDRGDHPALNPHASARFVLDGHEGVVGRLHPALAEHFDVPEDTFLLSFDIKELNRDYHVVYEASPRFPLVVRDLAFVLGEDVPGESLLAELRAEGGETLRTLEIFDVYRGPELPAEQRSLAVRLTFADRHGTLSDEEVSSVLARLVARAAERFGAKIRG